MKAICEVGTRDLLEAMAEPSLVLDTRTRVLIDNRAASAWFGPLAGRELARLAPDGHAADLRAYLVRCSGSRSPLPGTSTLRTADGVGRRFRCHGNLLTPARTGQAALVILRLSDAKDERFSVLARDLRHLNMEIRERRRAQAVLEEALRDRELLLRELHHRVKNNVQMLTGLIDGAQRESTAPEARAILTKVAGRLGAIGAVHQMLYRTNRIESLDSLRFAADLSAGILRSYGAEARLSSRGTAGAAIPNDAATPLALILNELLANAVKHGAPEGEIRVSLCCAGGKFELSVEDDGPGFDPAWPMKRASGIGLVRGLARQLAGSFTVERGERGGARCIVRFAIRGGTPVATDAAP